jgi:outer membrane autotransporter protein
MQSILSPFSNNSVATVRATLGWLRAFGDLLPFSMLAVGNSPGFAIAGVPIASDALLIDAGINLQIGKQATVGVYYNGQIARDAKDNGLRVDFNWKFWMMVGRPPNCRLL